MENDFEFSTTDGSGEVRSEEEFSVINEEARMAMGAPGRLLGIVRVR